MHIHNHVTATLTVLTAIFVQCVLGHGTLCPGTNINGICCIGSLDGPVISSMKGVTASVSSSFDSLLCAITGCTDNPAGTQTAAATTTSPSSIRGPETVIGSGMTCHGMAVAATASDYEAIISSVESASVSSEAFMASTTGSGSSTSSPSTVAFTTGSDSPKSSQSANLSTAGATATANAGAPAMTKAPMWIKGAGAAAVACLAF